MKNLKGVRLNSILKKKKALTSNCYEFCMGKIRLWRVYYFCYEKK